jgi:MFS family permease
VRSSAIIALLIVSLDAMGLGLIMPVLPTLLRELVPAEQVAGHYGALLSLYALMQVIFAPVLDNFQMLTVGVRCFWLLSGSRSRLHDYGISAGLMGALYRPTRFRRHGRNRSRSCLQPLPI